MNTAYSEKEIRNDYRKLTKLLIEKKMTITTMESATSGQIASLITDTEGSSAVLKGAFITYCNEAKIMQGVPADVLDKYTVYSKETAEAMVNACINAYGANVGIGVTGTMGNIDLANPNSSVPGQVYFAIGIDGDVKSYYIELAPQPTRLAYKLAVAKEIYNVLIERLREANPIIKFSRTGGKYGCFSNFYTCELEYEGIVYPNSECAWQSLKTFDRELRKKFSKYTASGAKRMGRHVKLREDWEEVKYDLMVNVCFAKFSQNESLKDILLSTGEDIIVENTTGWHDNIWGNCDCDKCKNKEGKNLLGKALMEVRAKLM